MGGVESLDIGLNGTGKDGAGGLPGLVDLARRPSPYARRHVNGEASPTAVAVDLVRNGRSIPGAQSESSSGTKRKGICSEGGRVARGAYLASVSA